jgi:putative oxidoreductase
MSLIEKVQDLVTRIARAVDWLPPLIARVVIGYAFMRNGWTKLHNLGDITDYFASLHIPAPALNAAFVSGVEFFGGILLMAGLLTRVAGFMLMCSMSVAIISAKKDDISGLADLGNLVEFTFALIFLYLAVYGAGRVSIDYFLKRALRSGAAVPSRDVELRSGAKQNS